MARPMDSTLASPAVRDAREPTRRPLAISNWLLSVAGLVFLMVVVGGITRLTESGLSITEWKPVSGAIPPLTHADWQRAFELYQQTPEYREINGPAGMTLSQFKFIFFWEWLHRLIGRLIGAAFALPLLWFAAKRAIPQGYGWKLVALLVLGGLQGALGWYMVMSGLVDRTDVSHFRLSAHLLLAFAIMSALIWVALDLRQLARSGENRPPRLTLPAVATLALLFVQLLYGAWVAGLDAGQVANDWPLMQGRFFPDGVDWSRGALFAFTNDPFLIHFVHRWWAWVVVAALVIFARRIRRVEGGRKASIAIHSAFGTQILLGIFTVLSGVAIWLAALHQAVGALVVASTVWGAHVLGRRPANSRRLP
jgi:cytochrome c oxidase assembly protein subunit 15